MSLKNIIALYKNHVTFKIYQIIDIVNNITKELLFV